MFMAHAMRSKIRSGGSLGSPFDPYWDNVVLLLKGDGTDGSTTFVDSSQSAHSITPVGNAQISTAQSKFGGSSMYFDGVNGYAEILQSEDFMFGTDDFTVEGLAYINEALPTYYELLFGQSTPGFNMFLVRFNQYKNTGTFGMTYRTNEVWGPNYSSGLVAPKFEWFHFAVVRSGSSIYYFINGIQGTTQSVDMGLQIGSDSTSFYLARNIINDTYAGPIYIDELRITKGVARYTEDFTPPSEPFPTQ